MDLITTLGLLAAACTTASFLPQAIKTIRTKQTKDLSFGMYSILTSGIFLWLVYGLFVKDLPIILANGISFVLSATILWQKVKYK